MNYSDSNGRVNILGDNVMDQFQLYDKVLTNNDDNYHKTAMTGNWESNVLSRTFFSKENIKKKSNTSLH